MKKFQRYLSGMTTVIMLAILAGSLSVTATGFPNGGFDDVTSLDEWTIVGSSEVLSEPTVGHTNLGSVSLGAANSATRTIGKQITLQPGYVYAIDVWYMTAAAGTSGNLYLCYYNENGIASASNTIKYVIEPIGAASDIWKNVRMNISVATETAGYIAARFTGAGGAKVYIDDFSLQSTQGMLVNGSFETELSDWEEYKSGSLTTGYTLTTTMADSVEGSRALHIHKPTSGSAYLGVKQLSLPFEEGKTYKLSLKVKTLNAKKAVARVRWLKNASEHNAQTNITVQSTGIWEEFTLYHTCPSGSTPTIGVGITSYQAVDELELYIDDIVLKEAAPEIGFKKTTDAQINFTVSEAEAGDMLKAYLYLPADAITETVSMLFITAGYKMQGTQMSLVSIETKEVALTAGTAYSTTTDAFAFGEAGSDVFVTKSFLWNSLSGLKPFTDSVGVLTQTQ